MNQGEGTGLGNHLLPPFEVYRGDLPYLFVSYAHRDSEIVFNELRHLNQSGYRIWYDEGIDPGNEWPEEIGKALSACAFFVVFISRRSVISENVRNEINMALKLRKPFLAIHLEETELPHGLELQMGARQAVMMYRLTPELLARKLSLTFPVDLSELTPQPQIPECPPVPRHRQSEPTIVQRAPPSERSNSIVGRDGTEDVPQADRGDASLAVADQAAVVVGTLSDTPQLESAMLKPALPPVARPVTAPVARPVTAPVARPVTAPVARPVTAPVARPVTAPVAQPVAVPVIVTAAPVKPEPLTNLFGNLEAESNSEAEPPTSSAKTISPNPKSFPADSSTAARPSQRQIWMAGGAGLLVVILAFVFRPRGDDDETSARSQKNSTAKKSNSLTTAKATPPTSSKSDAAATNTPRRIRFIRIELPRKGVLTLAEVEAFYDGRNVAPYGSAEQSTTESGAAAALAIDGNTSGKLSDNSHTLTKDTDEPWWQLDLGGTYPLEKIVIHNRTDAGMGEQLAGFTLLLLDQYRRPIVELRNQPAPNPHSEFVVDSLASTVPASATPAPTNSKPADFK